MPYEYADPEKRGHGSVPVETYRGREIYRTADMTLVTSPAGFEFCVENLRESDEGPTLHTEATIEACREFIDTEIESALFDALRSLTNSADGLSFREEAIRNIVGNTNWNVLRTHIDAARGAIAMAEAA